MNNSISSNEEENSLQIPSEQEKTLSLDELWEEIGFHRPLGGFWFQLTFSLISISFMIILAGIYYRVFYPYPESMGYRSAATGIFVLFFTIFDLGTHMTMSRYIAEMRIKNPLRMVKYIQYFIWYQMITGLIQTTLVSIYALVYVPRGELAYAIWIMLIHSTTQYPGFLGVFRGVLNSLQQFNKAEVLNFISGDVFQRITEIVFVLWGKQWGAQNPQIGEILGIAIGATIGFYVDDFFATLLSAYYFQKVMKNEGITVRRCFFIEFDWNLVKEALSFGVKTGIPDVIGLGSELIMLWEWIHFVPQYTTFVTLSGLAAGISNMVNYGMSIPLTQLFAEAYMNGKKELTRYYIAQYIRFATMVQFFFLGILGIVLMILDETFIGLGLENYILSIPFILPQVIRNLQQPFTSLADSVLTGTNHPTFLMIIRFAEELLKIIFMTLWLVILKLPLKYGLTAIIWIMPCGIYPAILFKTITNYIYINKNILKIRILWWQTAVAPAFTAVFIYGIGYLSKIIIFDSVLNATGNIVIAIFMMVTFTLFLLIFTFFPIDVALGGWDEYSLRDFHKAALMSGPSKFIVMPLYKFVEKVSEISPLHGRFGMDMKEATREARELLEIKRRNSELFKQASSV